MILKIKRPGLADVIRDVSSLYNRFAKMMFLKQNDLDPIYIKNSYGGLLYIHFYTNNLFDLLEIYTDKSIGTNGIVIGRLIEYDILHHRCRMCGEVTDAIIQHGWLLL